MQIYFEMLIDLFTFACIAEPKTLNFLKRIEAIQIPYY